MSIKVNGAVVREQGITFAIVLVKQHVVDNRAGADDFIASCGSLFPGMPIVLATQDHRGCFTYYGREDISRFLASIAPSRIPWREYTFAD